tara:strand:+ start:1231 stop:1506 length:276 start_codon:yes stop_codon:yes gene_type:complete
MLNYQIAQIGIKINRELDYIKLTSKKINYEDFLLKLFMIIKTKIFLTSFHNNFYRDNILDLLKQKYKKSFFLDGLKESYLRLMKSFNVRDL